jgi:2-polyprenyl-6-methoxyphenol hydroxylase-like FAD-dependent oxidoreductase
VKPLHALVIGAGIGGTAAAIALRRAGLDVSLFEQTMAQREVGAGIQISPNASRLLGRYGLGDAMARAAVRPSAIVFRRWQDGRVLGREELGDFIENRYGAPYYHFHRADLITLLGEAFGPKEIKLGRRLAYQREAPRLCRGGSRSLTFPAAIDERPRLVSHHAHEKEFRDGPVLMSLLTSEENRVVLRTYHCL